jgi:hypothetical protein
MNFKDAILMCLLPKNFNGYLPNQLLTNLNKSTGLEINAWYEMAKNEAVTLRVLVF